MRSGLTVASLYVIFAVTAITANLMTQRSVLAYGSNTNLFIAAVLSGTLVGLLVKYYLDRSFIFASLKTHPKPSKDEFVRYCVTGVVTTAIFWAFETLSFLVWRTDFAREAGAVTGLILGYIIKYRLDKKYVFA